MLSTMPRPFADPTTVSRSPPGAPPGTVPGMPSPPSGRPGVGVGVGDGPSPSPTIIRPDRPCDACRRRKSRCVINPDSASCVMCQFHKQACTFLEDAAPRRRKLANPVTNSDTATASAASLARQRRS